MKSLAVILTFMTFIFGLIAAWYWYKSSEVKIGQDDEPLFDETGIRIFKIEKDMKKAAYLNSIAARWTAASVLVGCLNSLAGIRLF